MAFDAERKGVTAQGFRCIARQGGNEAQPPFSDAIDRRVLWAQHDFTCYLQGTTPLADAETGEVVDHPGEWLLNRVANSDVAASGARGVADKRCTASYWAEKRLHERPL